MKRAGILLFVVTVTLLGFSQEAEEKFVVDTNRSSIEWKAGKVTGQHNGTIKLVSGNLLMNGNTLSGGSFIVNMGTISISDLKGKSRENLLNHLKSNTFFAVVDHPHSTFQITNVASAGENRVNITGNLRIKNITHSLSFPATVKKESNSLVAVAKGIKVDRTKYDIKYRSKTFFDVGDMAIHDEFEIAVNLVAKK